MIHPVCLHLRDDVWKPTPNVYKAGATVTQPHSRKTGLAVSLSALHQHFGPIPTYQPRQRISFKSNRSWVETIC